MNKIKIFDFDGVIFPNPSTVHDRIISCYWSEFSSAFRDQIMYHGRIPEHLLNIEEGLRYNKLFQEVYFGQKMDSFNKERIKAFADSHKLVIVSYNNKETIEHLLKNSKLDIFFDEVFSSNEINKKKEAFENIYQKYQIEKEKISFITDTYSDILESRDSGIHDIYLAKLKIDFTDGIPLHKIMKPFFKKFDIKKKAD